MIKIKCPYCEEPVTISISKAIDEEGEVFLCPHCNKPFRFVEK